MLDICNLSYSIGGRVLLNNLSCSIPSRQVVGVIGVNGCGKSTLFRLILGDLVLEAGEIKKIKDAKIVSICQEIKDTSETLMNFVLQADETLMQLRQALEIEHDGNKIAEICEQLEAIDGFNAEIRASTILSGLGFKSNEVDCPLREFSGGWQIRAAIAATLFAPSDILLLDEPTNHLDFETALWLRNYLQKIKAEKTILLVSHDRDFLNVLCDKILHLPSGDLYTGNYDNFIKIRAVQQQNLERRIEKQEATRQHLQSFVDRFRYKATKAKQAQSRLKMLEKMEQLPPLDRDYVVQFSFPNPKPIDRQLICIKKGVAGYGQKVVLRDLNLKISAGDRVALLGINGNGKSTLVKVLSGNLPLLDGTIEYAKGLQIAYFSQQLTDCLALDQTPYEILAKLLPNETESVIRSQLARFGLIQQKATTLVKDLSGGEKTRLLLAMITRKAPHILILDEPTNHLDIEAKDALAEALNQYEGAVVLVSHDFYVVEMVCDQLLWVKEHRCTPFDGDLDDYVAEVLEKKPKQQNGAKDKKSDTKRSSKKLEQLKRRLALLEEQLQELASKKQQLEEQLNAAYSVELFNELQILERIISGKEQEWLEGSNEIEVLGG